MNDASKARPVSGEIMTGETVAAPFAARTGQSFIEAEFETLAPSLEPAAPRQADFAASRTEVPGLGVLKRPDVPASGRRQPGGPAFWTFGLCLVAAAFWVPADTPFFPLSVSRRFSRDRQP
jgi:hypothetical protein